MTSKLSREPTHKERPTHSWHVKNDIERLIKEGKLSQFVKNESYKRDKDNDENFVKIKLKSIKDLSLFLNFLLFPLAFN